MMLFTCGFRSDSGHPHTGVTSSRQKAGRGTPCGPRLSRAVRGAGRHRLWAFWAALTTDLTTTQATYTRRTTLTTPLGMSYFAWSEAPPGAGSVAVKGRVPPGGNERDCAGSERSYQERFGPGDLLRVGRQVVANGDR